jgi:hypothetical protein
MAGEEWIRPVLDVQVCMCMGYAEWNGRCGE